MGAKKFNFDAKTQSGRWVRGLVEATDENQAQTLVRRAKLSLTKLKEDKKTSSKTGGLRKARISERDLMYFFKKMSKLTEAGLLITKALEILQENEKLDSFSATIQTMKTCIEKGMTLKNTFSFAPKIFSPYMINMVGIGEESGTLSKSFSEIYLYLERKRNLKIKVKSALTYPLFLLISSIGLTIFLLVFVVPEFQKVFVNAGKELPAVTLAVIAASEVVQRYWLICFAALFAGFSFVFTLYQFEAGKNTFDRLILKVPFFGKIILYSDVIKFLDSFATLNSSGFNVSSSFALCADVVSNSTVSQKIVELKGDVERGSEVTSALKRAAIFPSIVLEMASIGDSTGDLGQTLQEASAYIEEDLSETIKTATGLIEPAALFGIGALVVTILLAMYLPIFQIADVMQ